MHLKLEQAVTLTFGFLTLKMVSKSRVTWATSVRVRTIPWSIPNTNWPPAIPIPNTDTDTEYDVFRTTHQCHTFISTGQCYSHSHYRRGSDGWTVCDMRRARWGSIHERSWTVVNW